MHQIGYYLDEDKNWSLDMDVLEKAYQDATEVCNPRYFGLIFLINFIQFYSIVLIFFCFRAIVIINPGNPTGNVLSRANIEAVVKFAAQKKLFVFADEVYQDNVYADGCEFHSFKKVIFNKNFVKLRGNEILPKNYSSQVFFSLKIFLGYERNGSTI